MANVIGIDLGTTYSCIAYLEGGEPRVIPNLDGFQTTPSVVSFTNSGEELIGNLALRQSLTNPEMTVYSVKRLIGKKYSSEGIQEAKKRIAYNLTESPNGDVMIKIDSRIISPQEISGMILRYLKKCAESFFGQGISEVVVTVPAHFNDHQRQATKDAAKIAGLEVLRVINEPTSASLAYGLHNRKNLTIAVYDMGGGTFDITLMEISDGIFNVLATNGSSFLGGEDFDNRIVDWLIEDFKKENHIDLSENKLALQRIKESAEKAKRELSFTLESEINLPFIFSDKSSSKHIMKNLSRKRLEELTKDLVEKTFPFMDQAFTDAKLGPGDVDEVILVGGQTQMPLIKKAITDFFGKKPVEKINPEEIVAMGAAIQTGILKGKMEELVVLLDVNPLSLGIETENDGYVKIIEKNTTIPTKKSMSFTTVENNQRKVKVHVLQGESKKASENTSLGIFNLIGIEEAPASVPQIDVTFEINSDGIVRVSAKDVSTGSIQAIEVKPSSGLSKKEINKIIKRNQPEESEVHNNGKTGLL